MPFVITDICVKDGACVEVCPVECIHTTPTSPQFYVDPEICIECQQCFIVCPVQAVYLHSELPMEHMVAAERNAAFFRQTKEIPGRIPLETAEHIVKAAVDFATEKGITICVAIVDDAGIPVLVSRMDGATDYSAELALNKAVTATTFLLPTNGIGAYTGRSYFRSLTVGSHGKVMTGGGGIPIVDEMFLLGAIGIAGGPSNGEDNLCCRAGLAVLDDYGHLAGAGHH
jgi:ferredoxin